MGDKGSTELLSELQKILPNQVFFSEAVLKSYSYDASPLLGHPTAVVIPETKEAILEVLKLAQHFKVPIIPRGAGTSTTGSSVPLHGGIVLSLMKLNRILEVNLEERVVCCQPGLLTGDLKKYLVKDKLFYPPDPSSYAFSTIGGNIATGAGGPRGLKYGTTKDYVLSLEVGLPGGKLLKTGPPTLKKSSRYNLTPLFVGSEGTLGIILEIWLKVIPLPEKRHLFLVKAKEEASLLLFISQILKEGITPATAEFVDKTSLEALKRFQHSEIEEETHGLLFLEIDGKACCVEREKEQIKDLLKGHGFDFIEASTEEEMEILWDLRRSLSPSLRVLGSKKISDDVTIPRRYNLEFLKYLRALEEESGVKISAFGHVGDGNFHVNLYFEVEEEKKAKDLRERILNKVWRFSGTISGEHGIGFLKKEFLARELTQEELELMRGLKTLFDPENLLNPRVKIP